MKSKHDDYDYVVKVILSCKTSRQNNVAYKMCWNFHDMYKDDILSLRLFRVCDENLVDIMQGRRR